MIDLKKTTPTQKNLLKLLDNRDWLEDNLKDIQEKYVEKWVAIADKKVISHGNTPDEVKKNITGDFSSIETLLLRVPKGDISRPV